MAVKLTTIARHDFDEGNTAYDYKLELHWRKGQQSGLAERYYEDTDDAFDFLKKKLASATANGYTCDAYLFHWSDGLIFKTSNLNNRW